MVPLLTEVAIEQRVSFVYYYILRIDSASVWVFDVDILKKFVVFKQIWGTRRMKMIGAGRKKLQTSQMFTRNYNHMSWHIKL